MDNLKYIKITEGVSALISQLNYNLSEIEVKGESVKFLFNSRLIIKEILESAISEEEILKQIEKPSKEE